MRGADQGVAAPDAPGTGEGEHGSDAGSGDVRFQLVRRFNVLLADDRTQTDMALEVEYDADHVEVDDVVNVTATVRYFGLKDSTGMMIVDDSGGGCG